MSASREKKKRQEQVAPEAVAEIKTGMSKGLKTVLGVIVALALVAVIVFFAMVNGGYFESNSTAAIVNGHKLSPAMVNYYYTNAYSSMGDYLSVLTDPETPLDEQECMMMTDGGTWADYFMDTAMSNAASTYAIYDEAIANGHTLSEAGQLEIDNQLAYLEMMGSINGYTNIDSVIAAQFGRGCNAESFTEFLTMNYIAQEYSTKVAESFTYTQDELDAYYAENPALFDGYNFRMFEVVPEKTEGENDEMVITDEALVAASEVAKAMAEEAKGNEQAFIELALENAAEENKSVYEDDDATLREDIVADSMNAAYKDWLTDEARAEGDTTYVANTNGDAFIVLYYIGAVDHNYQLPNVRHILIGVTDTADETAMAEAKEKAEALLAEFQAGEATEEAFAALVADNSTDTGSVENGGLYESIAPMTMVDAFDAWCFEDGRQAGDTGIVETQYGYHIMYFSGYSDVTYHNYLVENTMLNNDYTAWMTDITADANTEIVSTKYVETR